MPKRPSNRRRRRRGGLGPVLRVMSVLLMAVAIVAALTLFFKVQRVEVSGAGRYTQEEILTVSGIQEGDNLILLDKYRIAEKLYTKLPYITSVRISRKFPDTLMLEVTETRAAAAVEGAGSWWLITSTGKILESVEETAARDYLQLEHIEAVEPALAESLQLAQESNLSVQRLLELMEALEEREMLTRTDSIDAGDPEQLVIGYDGRFRVEMYYEADFVFKLNCLKGAVAELEPNETGTLRMTMKDDNEVRFIPYQ